MDLLTFTLMVSQAAEKAGQFMPGVSTWTFRTWSTCDNGIWVDCNPAFPPLNSKFAVDGTPWIWA